MMSDAAIARIEEICKEYPNKKSALVPALYVAQREYGGWLPREALREVAEELDLPDSHVYAVASFYSMFFLKPVGQNIIQICTTSPCELRGARDAVECFKKRLGVGVGETTADNQFTLMEVECLAACDRAPMAQINEDYYLDIDEARANEIVDALSRGEKPPYAEFTKNLGGCHPIAFSDEELGIDVSGILPAEPVVKKEKPVEAPADAAAKA
jgi:NADH dehydrogenase (ubiquinone) flavoprotein 2